MRLPRRAISLLEPLPPTCAEVQKQVGRLRHNAPCRILSLTSIPVVFQVVLVRPFQPVVNNGLGLLPSSRTTL